MAKFIIVPEIDIAKFPEKALEIVAREIGAIEQTKQQIVLRIDEIDQGFVVRNGKKVKVDVQRAKRDIVERVGSLRNSGEVKGMYTADEAIVHFRQKRYIPLNEQADIVEE